MNPESSSIYLLNHSLENNLEFIRSKLQKKTRLCAVVKGNAYGHGLEEFANLLLRQKVDYYAVYSIEEAVRLKRILPNHVSIVVMGDTGLDSLEWCIRNQIEFFVFDFERLHQASMLAKKNGITAKIHLELETGMNRTGFELNKLEKLSKQLYDYRSEIEIEGICTHFAGSELNSNLARVKNQSYKFEKMCNTLDHLGIVAKMKHTCCSAALIKLPEMQQDMVRCGILLYGFWPSDEMAKEFESQHKSNPNPLKRVIRWQSHVMSIKDIEAGEWIGYGEIYKSSQNIKIAVIPVGYAHGYARSLSNQGTVLIKGQKLPVVGYVNMNCLTVDISGMDNISIGDEVVLIGHQGAREISVASFAERSEQLNYEMLTRLPSGISRNIIF